MKYISKPKTLIFLGPRKIGRGRVGRGQGYIDWELDDRVETEPDGAALPAGRDIRGLLADAVGDADLPDRPPYVFGVQQ
jgi:hypothetical protein